VDVLLNDAKALGVDFHPLKWLLHLGVETALIDFNKGVLVSKRNKQVLGGVGAHAAAFDPMQGFQQALVSYSARDWQGAEAICQRVLDLFPEHVDTLHLLGSIRLQTERFDEALQVLEPAQQLQPGNPGIANKLGIVLMHLKRPDEALAQFAAALSIDARLAEVYAARGALHESLGQNDAAVADLAKAVELRPDFVLGHLMLGNRLAAMDQIAQAVACYDRALALAPDFADALHARGNALRELQRFDDALQSYEQALRGAPQHLAALASQADLLVHLGRQEAALPVLNQVIRLKPDHLEALLLRGTLRYQRTELDAAQADFARVVQLDPNRYEGFLNIGNVHFSMRRYPQALGNYDAALRLRPDNAIAHLCRSMVLEAGGELDQALEANARALALDPELAEAISNQGSLLVSARQLEAAVQCFRKACELKPDLANARSSLLYALIFMRDVEPEQVREEALRWNQQHAAGLPTYRHSVPGAAPRRLRLGYVSSDLRNHAVANFMEPVLQSHDGKAFDVHCYHCSPLYDAVSKTLSRHVKHWVDASRLSAEALAQRIHEDRIDVLVDLAGHTAGNRLLSFARRPAPVQFTYLGYPGTTGLGAMDYRITDIYTDPPEAQAHYTENLLRLPHSLWCYRPAAGMPSISPLPASHRGHLTLGSFNGFRKLDRRSVELWAKLMRAVPDARLVVATVPEGAARSAFLEEMVALGVGAARIDILGNLSSLEFWNGLASVDIALDPVSVNGATTSCESLWLGVPVLSRVGGRFLERAGLSILSTAGLPEFACETDEACVELVQGLAADLPRLAALRAGMRAQLRPTTLIDAKAFTRSLEQLYREGWERWAQDPRSLEV
jgi:predicted O-linked N-acetylglucosamine transferase (SPINDLY family)